jgi:methionyl-tRNA formyltransferase
VRVVFMGTPHFAVESLKRIYESKNHEIVGVVTATDKPAGRGQKLTPSPIKEFAIENQLFLMQPEKLKSTSFLETLQSLKADIFVVVAFRMLPEVVWQMPKMGTVNLHSSLLPQYRGAAPINWAIINGETKTGVTTFFIEQKMDMGNIIDQEEVLIDDSMNAGILHDKLMIVGADLLLKTLDSISNGNFKNIPQQNLEVGEIKEAFKIFKETCKIDWNNDARTIYNLIRGLSPYPAAFSTIYIDQEELTAKIFETQIVQENTKLEIGQTDTDGKSFLNVGCKQGTLSIKSIQLQGKSRLKITEFLNGVRGKTIHFTS